MVRLYRWVHPARQHLPRRGPDGLGRLLRDGRGRSPAGRMRLPEWELLRLRRGLPCGQNVPQRQLLPRRQSESPVCPEHLRRGALERIESVVTIKSAAPHPDLDGPPASAGPPGP